MRPDRHDLQRARVAVVTLAMAAFASGALLPLGTLAPAAAIAAASTTPGGQTATSAAPCPTSNPPNELLLDAGTPQTAQLDAAFASALQVTLANTNGCPVTAVAGTPVTFTAPVGSASATFAASGGSELTVGADSSGDASAGSVTADDTAGSYTVTAQTAYGSVSFSLTNTAVGIPATLAALSPTVQQAIAGDQYKDPLSVRVLDADGTPVSGVTVTFTLGAGGAGGAGDGASAGSSASGGSGGDGEGAGATFVSGSSTATAETDSDGVANSPTFAADQSAGSFAAFAAVPEIEQPASFRLVNLPARAARLTRLGRRRRSATAGQPYRGRLRVRLRNASGRPVIGATVTFTLGTASGSGSSSGGDTSTGLAAGASFASGTNIATATTGIGGIAVSPPLTANAVAGSFTAVATSTTTTSVVRFTLTNLPGRGDRLTTLGSSRRSATVARPYARRLAVQLVDASGRPLIGALVTFTLSTGTGSSTSSAQGTSGAGSAGASFLGGGTQAAETTNSSGIASSPRFAANTTAGSFTATASTAGSSSTATFQLDNRPGAPASLTAGAGATQTTTIGTRFPIPLAITVNDAFGNPVPSAPVTFAAPAAGASGSFGGRRTVTVRTNRHGIAEAPPLTAARVIGGYIVIATAGHAPAAAFALVNEAP